MNPFHILWIALSISCCKSQNELSKSSLNTGSEHAIRCDTYQRNHEIKYTWIIRNFSSYEANGIYKEFWSPNLRASTTDKYVWFIKLTAPNGHMLRPGLENPIGLDVYLSYKSAVKKASVKYNISLLNHEKETLLHRSSPSVNITTESSKYWPDFCRKDDFFRKRILQNDTMIMSINITWSGLFSNEISHQREVSSSAHAAPETIKCSPLENYDSIFENSKLAELIFSSNAGDYRCEAYVQVHELKYTWAIHNFSLYETANEIEILSPKLYAPTTNRYEWQIKITPGNTIGLYLYLSSESIVKKALAKYVISIINHHNEVLHERQSPIAKLAAGEGIYWEFHEKDDCFWKHILRNDTLILLIHIKWISESSANTPNVSHHRTSNSTAPTPKPATTKHSNFSENFESMLENPQFADVVFATNGSNYPAHRAILAARSPVFATMFRRKDAKDGKLRKIRVNVTNINEQVLRAMLRYIYTGKCENFTESADELFVVAVKYGLNGLRDICEQTLCETLSVENAAKMLVFAKKHHVDELKLKAAELLENTSTRNSNATAEN